MSNQNQTFRLSQLDPLPKIKNVLYERTIGQGSFALVKVAYVISKPYQRFAVKLINVKASKRSGLTQQQIGQEVLLHKNCCAHPNIIKVMDFGSDSNWLYIAMELAVGGDLFDKIEPDYGVDEEIAHFYFKQLISSVEFIHSKGVAHRDIKPENILLDKNGNLKLTDFGLAAVYQKKDGTKRNCMTPCGSPPYMAPEVAQLKGYNPAIADIWSCGIVLYVLLTGQTPWEEPTLQDPDFKNFLQNDGKIFDPPWNKFEPSILSLLRSILKPEPLKRIALENIRKHLWVNQSNIFSSGDSTLCSNTTLLTTRLLSNLHIGLSDDASNDEAVFNTINNSDSQQSLAKFSNSQPVNDMACLIDDDDNDHTQEFFSATQEVYSEHSKKRRKLLYESNDKDGQMLQLVSKDPSILQFINKDRNNAIKDFYQNLHLDAGNISIFGDRLTKFFSILPLESLLSSLFDSLHRVGAKTNANNEQQLLKNIKNREENNNNSIYITLTTLDRKKLPLNGNIKISKVASNLELRKIEFLKTKGDPLEWRKFFKTITILCKDVVYIDPECFNKNNSRPSDRLEEESGSGSEEEDEDEDYKKDTDSYKRKKRISLS
ncbi:hypothetical protein PACTADRAFT_4293 [Pachysolen tannophilus NRRL Y-2460]|uniref:non-specific serine/threonine protein kinase n=1 Tax=Pachysolen tannophilus NRRL Y-2460 TaxID=669874 RepID=A0A1E4TRI3_PACTA|nr:hypothetical protein PACTADRAFT_4293 [Pachysolen tannophilus NRRL Y-2460]